RPAQRRAGDHGARSGDARPRDPGSLPALLPLLLHQRVQLSRPVDPQPQSPARQCRGRRRHQDRLHPRFRLQSRDLDAPRQPPSKPEQSKFEPQAKPEPAPLTSGVIQTQAIAAIPGSAEPMKPVKVKTVQIKAGPMKLASAGPSQPAAPPITNAIPPARPEV